MARRLAKFAEALSGWLLPVRAWAAREAGWLRGAIGPSADL